MDLVLDGAGQNRQLVIGNFFRSDDDPKFATGLDSEGFGDTLMAISNLFKSVKPLDVVLDVFVAGIASAM